MGGKPRAPRAARHQPLRVDVEGGRLIIGIGVETLAFAVENAPGPPLTVYDAEARDFVHTKVADPDAFAIEVRRALLAEEEDGSTLLDRMLDEAPPGCHHVKTIGLSTGAGFHMRAVTIFEREQDGLWGGES